jgi:hypothetical protein
VRNLPGFGPKFIRLASGGDHFPDRANLWTAILAQAAGAALMVNGGFAF